MALVRWLKDNKDVIKYQYYYDGSSESKHPDYYQGIYSTRETDRYRVAGKYFYFGCCKSAVENYLKEKSLGEKQQAIIEIDPITRRNTFHTLFTTELYPSLTTGPKDYYISWAHWSDLKSLALNDEISYWSDNKHYLRYKAQHEECIQNNQLTSATNKDYRKNSLSNLFTFLLSQFEKADDSLMKAFLQHDERGNTPLFYAFQKYTNEFNYDSLHEFLQKSGTANTGRLYLEPNQYDKTLLHVIFSLSTDDSLEWHMDLLDPATIKDAFRAKDQVGNTPLHDLFLLRKKLTNTFVEKVCQAIKTASENTGKQGEMEQKQDQLPDYLTVNLDNANPLHYLCQRDPRNEENLSMLKTMLQFAGHLKSEKIMQQDKFHMTPVHYAIKSGNFSLAEEMLNRLMGQDQLNLILMKHNKHETLLHFICQYGNPALLEQAILIIGPLKCYEIRKQVPLKASSSNKNLSQEQLESTVNKYSRLFNTFDYFVEKYKKGVFAT
ncbi:MAG TPA: hypothetical protein VLJ15_03020, partial [Gammaproteobacteria bacterium]|nr:hypothetical protein [Gammaproteobacteria bacterium]